MKTISQHPFAIGRLLAADRARRARLARRYDFWHSPWTTLAFSAVLIALLVYFFSEVL